MNKKNVPFGSIHPSSYQFEIKLPVQFPASIGTIDIIQIRTFSRKIPDMSGLVPREMLDESF